MRQCCHRITPPTAALSSWTTSALLCHRHPTEGKVKLASPPAPPTAASPPAPVHFHAALAPHRAPPFPPSSPSLRTHPVSTVHAVVTRLLTWMLEAASTRRWALITRVSVTTIMADPEQLPPPLQSVTLSRSCAPILATPWSSCQRAQGRSSPRPLAPSQAAPSARTMACTWRGRVWTGDGRWAEGYHGRLARLLRRLQRKEGGSTRRYIS
mmetsp:Transcript_23120/g.46255  ORF Transcript_23120/g.46255 Transcript_23120/m.46255 type:complete len:211 (+) Transcript_23120:78-710(+)